MENQTNENQPNQRGNTVEGEDFGETQPPLLTQTTENNNDQTQKQTKPKELLSPKSGTASSSPNKQHNI